MQPAVRSFHHSAPRPDPRRVRLLRGTSPCFRKSRPGSSDPTAASADSRNRTRGPGSVSRPAVKSPKIRS